MVVVGTRRLTAKGTDKEGESFNTEAAFKIVTNTILIQYESNQNKGEN
jgi:hypothetical protein